jgi:hypothetical protein
MNALAVKIAVAHHLGPSKNFCIEFERAIHMLHCKPEMLHTLEPRAERTVVARHISPTRALCDRRTDGARDRQSANQRSSGLKNASPLEACFVGVSIFTHILAPLPV